MSNLLNIEPQSDIANPGQDRHNSSQQMSEERFRSLVAATAQVVWTTDPQGAFVEAQSSWEAFTGQSEDEAKGWGRFDAVHPEDRESAKAAWSEALARKRPFVLELRLRRHDGEYRRFKVRGVPVQDRDGSIREWVGTCADITEKWQAERFQAGQNRVLELLATGHDLQEVLTALIQTVEEQVPGMIGSVLLLDEQGQHLLHGAAPHLPQDYVQAVHGLRIGPCAGCCGTAAYRNEPVIVEDILSDPLWADYRAIAELCGQRACWSQPIHASDNRVLGTFAMYFSECRRPTAEEIRLIESAAHLAGVAIERQQADLALKRAKEAAEAGNRAKDQFLAILPHELRTPLTPVLARLKLMQRQPGLPADMCTALETVRRNVEMEARIIDDLLDLTKIAKGQMQLRFETVDAHQQLRLAAEIFQAEIAAKPLRLIIDLRAEDHWVRADPARLQQVFWNLISNAVKYTPPHGTITLRSMNEPRGFLKVQVIDTGIGIEPEVMRRLFTAFEQGEQTLTRQFAGLGLGLSISKRLMDMQGGSLTAASAGTDQGATFTVELPTVAHPQ